MDKLSEIRDLLVGYGCKISPCGSRVTNSIVGSDSDWDFLVQLPSDENIVGIIYADLVALGFEHECAERYQCAISVFMSFRRGDTNLILTTSREFIELHKLATLVCTELDLPDKYHRQVVFQAILYGSFGGIRKVSDDTTFCGL